MKGLLLKDFYMVTKYCRGYLLIAAVFIAVSVIDIGISTFSAVLCLIAGILPVTLMAYDERSRWTEYSGTLPYSKAQIVSSKYLIGLLAQITVIVFTVLIKSVVKGFDNILFELAVLAYGFVISCAMAAVVLPFMFWLGVEKGRIAYYITMVTVFACVFAIADFYGEEGFSSLLGDATSVTLAIIPLAAIALYAVSWCISIALYKKREVK